MQYAKTRTRSTDRALVVDFGSQFTQLIARRLRESGVYCEIHPFHAVNSPMLEEYAPGAIILSGGPMSAGSGESPRVDPAVFRCRVPVLGICYGQQTMCVALGGDVVSSDRKEFGNAQVDVVMDTPLFKDVWQTGKQYPVWMSHGDRVNSMPEGFSVIAKSGAAPFAAIADEKKRLYGVQFHPEVFHTPDGSALLKNFTHGICGFSGDWTMAAFRDEAIRSIREQTGPARIICGLSGGVDSSVTAALLHEAVGERLTCIFVDTGLMRSGEGENVVRLFRESFRIPLVHVRAGDFFFDRLEGVCDPEEKRRIIGKAFIEIFEKEARKIEDARYLAQGTLYPDVIESVSFTGGPSATIKSHHNVGGLPDRMNLKLVEPLRELFKDEVRVLGRELGLPADLVDRHPFPGPGLAIRIPGSVTREKADILVKADAVYLDEIRKAGLYEKIWQAFAVLLPVRTVGVMGDERTYDYVLALRAVTSTDGMTADYYPFAQEFLARCSARIINEVRGINRVVYDITSKPPGTIEWE